MLLLEAAGVTGNSYAGLVTFLLLPGLFILGLLLMVGVVAATFILYWILLEWAPFGLKVRAIREAVESQGTSHAPHSSSRLRSDSHPSLGSSLQSSKPSSQASRMQATWLPEPTR